MRLIDVLTSPWAILPDKLLEIQAIYATHLRGEKIDVEAIEARLGRPLANEQQEYSVDGGVGVLSVEGVIAAKANLFTKVSGGASAQMLTKQVESMRADSRVRSVVLAIDSPGGSVLGTPMLADAVWQLSAEKPTVAVCTGQMCSAAYWIGSAANKLYISGGTDMVGSIGVVATHSYTPARDGTRTTEITAGKYKRIASSSKPLDEAGQAYMQQQVDAIYGVFVETVAANRGVPVDKVLQEMADGKVFIGQQAIDAGLVDGFGTVDQLIEQLSQDPQKFTARRGASMPSASSAGDAPQASAEGAPVERADTPKEAGMPTLEALREEHPEIVEALRAEGAEAERERIRAVQAQAIPGHEALIDALAFDGKTSPGEAAQQVLAAERARVGAVAANLAGDRAAPLALDPAPDGDKPAAQTAGPRTPRGYSVSTEKAEIDAKAKAYMKDNPGTDYLAAVRLVTKEA